MTVQTFRKKPVEIQAVQWTGDNWEELIPFIGSAGTLGPRDMGDVSAGTVEICTLEGTMTATAGDWIIRGVKGEFYPCKPDIFEATYEPVPHRGCGPDCSEQHTYAAGCAIKPPARAFLGEPPCGNPRCPCGGAQQAQP